MASPILLGNTPILRHGLGAQGSNVNAPGGGWAGTFGVGWVLLFQWTFSITHPDGAVAYGRCCWNCYSAVAGSTIEGCAQIDGGGLVGYGKHFFNNPSGQVWNQFCFSFNSNPWGRLSQGAHTINTGVYVLGGQCTFDSNSGGTAIGFEVPS